MKKWMMAGIIVLTMSCVARAEEEVVMPTYEACSVELSQVKATLSETQIELEDLRAKLRDAEPILEPAN